MTRPARAVTYAAVLRTPGAAGAFTAATLTRLSYGTVVLSLLLTVHQATGSFGAAGAAIAIFGLPSALLPLKARLLDRYGRAVVLVPLGVGYAAALLALAALGAEATAPAGGYVVLAVVAGLLAPPVGAVMRAIWAALTPEPAVRQRAYSLDTVVEEGLFVLGPVLVGLLTAVVDAWAALVLTAALALVGSLALSVTGPRAARIGAARSSPAAEGLGPLRLPRFRWLLLVVLAMSLAMSPIDLAVVARAGDLGSADDAGLLLAVLSLGSVVGGLLWGRAVHRRPYVRQLLGLLLMLAAGTALTGAAPNLLLVAGALALTGLAVAPVFVVAYMAADELVSAQVRTEATTWVATVSNVGGSLGMAGAGLLVDRLSPQRALLLAAGALAAAVPLLAAQSRRLSPRRPVTAGTLTGRGSPSPPR